MARIAIIGTGRMATGLAAGWAARGHEVVLGSRDPAARAEVLARASGATLAGIDAALEDAEVVVLAIPFAAVEPFARARAAQLQGRLVIDISNPFGHLPDNRIAGAEITAAAIGPGARVVAAFKDNFWQTLAQPVGPHGIVRDVHFAGDNEADKRIVTRLIEDLGFRPIDCGPLKNARVLDAMVPLMLELDERYNARARTSSWKFLV
jgi:NADPH-dependent F420 reductase